MITFPNAKINIGLNIIEKRADGYHNLESCFFPIDWSDILEIVVADELSFKSTGLAIPGSGDQNLCLSAYHLIKEDYDIPPVKIHLHKVVPIGAGLGGGSSDAAFMIKLLNGVFELNLDAAEMEIYASRLGSDCPFFIDNIPVFAEGTGNVFSPVTIDLDDQYIGLVNPNIHISTKEAYDGVLPKQPEVSAHQVIENVPISAWKDLLVNDFEAGIFKKYPKIEKIKNELYHMGAQYAAMTGSGSTVYGIFETEPDFTAFEGMSYHIMKPK